MKTAIVTGATGCLGRNLVNVLQKDGWSVVVLHRKSSDLSRLKGSDVEAREVNLHDLDSVRNAVHEGTDAIFHVAANTSHWSRDRQEQWKDNVLSTRNLVEAALEKHVKRFIFTSTGATIPYQGLDERLSSEIKNSYIRTKHLSELEVYKGVERGLDAVVIQPIIVVGAYDYNSFASVFVSLKRGDLPVAFPGRIAFCHARSVADAHLRAFYQGRCCEHYVLGGTYTTWLDFFQRVALAVGAKPPRKATPRWVLSVISHAMATLSFFTGKKPLLSPELVSLLQDAPDVSYPEKRKARDDLGYESASFESMISDCQDWLKVEGRI